MILPLPRLLEILEDIRRELPWVIRVGTYASAKSLRMKSDDELRQLRDAGIGIVYMGLESGDDAILKSMNKNGDSADIIEQGRRARRAGFKLNVTVINGLGGVEHSMRHARETARALSKWIRIRSVRSVSCLFPEPRCMICGNGVNSFCPMHRACLLKSGRCLPD